MAYTPFWALLFMLGESLHFFECIMPFVTCAYSFIVLRDGLVFTITIGGILVIFLSFGGIFLCRLFFLLSFSLVEVGSCPIPLSTGLCLCTHPVLCTAVLVLHCFTHFSSLAASFSVYWKYFLSLMIWSNLCRQWVTFALKTDWKGL